MVEGGAIQDFGQHGALADRTLRYVLASRKLHERLRQVLTQAAGFALLVMTRGSTLPMLDAPVALARSALHPARDEIDALAVPPRARHHHRHLIAAAAALEQSLALLAGCLHRDGGEAALVRSLRRATDHVRAAARLLPGFEMVDLTQACCAAHAGPRRLACD